MTPRNTWLVVLVAIVVQLLFHTAAITAAREKSALSDIFTNPIKELVSAFRIKLAKPTVQVVNPQESKVVDKPSMIEAPRNIPTHNCKQGSRLDQAGNCREVMD